MEGPVEYLSEWPPSTTEHQPTATKRGNEELQTAPPKRTKTVPHSTFDSQHEGLCRPSVGEGLVARAPTVPISTLLAQWWKSSVRSRAGSGTSESVVSSSHNPRTLLHHISKLPEARGFLTARVNYLETLDEDAVTHHALAATHYLLQHYSKALEYSRKALGGNPDNKELLWHHELVMRQNKVLQEGADKLAGLASTEHLKMPKATQVESRSAVDLSYKEFFTEYALTHTPVVITDAVDKMVTQPWTFDLIKEVMGSKVAPLKRVVHGSVEWARLEPAGETSVSQFVDSICQDTSSTELRYLFDWSLPLHCPELAKQLTIPRYFGGDFLQRTPPGSLYRDSWPSLFLSPAGITSELHVDAFGSNFWMALFQGRKRWTFFPPEDLPLLYPLFPDSTDAVFQVDLSQPDLSLHPLLSLSHPTQVTLSPGELLFVPAGSPHRVENLEPSLAISANFVDSSNLDGVLRELRVNGLRDPRAQALLEAIEGPEFRGEMDYGQNDLPWNEFKTWPR
jgi:hypothetical protein